LTLLLSVSSIHKTSTLSLHDALPILPPENQRGHREIRGPVDERPRFHHAHQDHAGGKTRGHTARRSQRLPVLRLRNHGGGGGHSDRKSTRLNSSHVKISYAVFCLKKK